MHLVNAGVDNDAGDGEDEDVDEDAGGNSLKRPTAAAAGAAARPNTWLLIFFSLLSTSNFFCLARMKMPNLVLSTS